MYSILPFSKKKITFRHLYYFRLYKLLGLGEKISLFGKLSNKNKTRAYKRLPYLSRPHVCTNKNHYIVIVFLSFLFVFTFYANLLKSHITFVLWLFNTAKQTDKV
jgi:hypothetical protein